MNQKIVNAVRSIIGEDWFSQLKDEVEKPYFSNILLKIDELRKQPYSNIFPLNKDIFNAYKYTSFKSVRVVIIGQDPYYLPYQAHGLAFSTLEKETPASLVNIFTEIKRSCYPDEMYHNLFKSNDLTQWAKQGVFLLNSILTVGELTPLNHEFLGWQAFIEYSLVKLAQRKEPIIFLCWGSKAKILGERVEAISRLSGTSHLVLFSSHPGPRSVNDGFFGCNHFKAANKFLEIEKQKQIDWKTYDRTNE